MHSSLSRFFATAIMIATILTGAGSPSYTRAGSDAPPAAVSYYDDAAGVFTLEPPSSIIGAQLNLAGTAALPELAVKIRNTSTRGPARQAVYRTGGKKSFNFDYIIKDGPGDYEVIIFGRRDLNALEMRGLCIFVVRSTGESSRKRSGPDINRCIMSYVKSVMGKTVGRGECWDLAQEALDGCGADWERPWNFGRLLDPEKDEVRPGDIIQFRTVRIVEKFPNGSSRWEVFGAPDHTAVVYEVLGPREYRLAHQNTGGKRHVLTSTVNLNLVTSGRFRIYRPVAGIVK